jgi:phage terminase large subunit
VASLARKMNINVPPKMFNKAYLPYLENDNRYNVFYGGAGSGKSRFLAMKLTLDLLKQKQKLLVIRQTLASLRDSTFEEFNQVFALFKI